MDISTIIPHAEAIIFASDKPVTSIDLVELLNNALAFMEDRATLDQVESALDAIREKYQSEFYPFQVIQSGGGWQFLTKKEYHPTINQLNGQKFMKKLSTAALETLSIIAYKQPITKGEIENIRGVNCDYAVQKLLEKELVLIIGRKEDAPGQPLIYATSKNFMDYFGINSPADLPQLGDIGSSAGVNPTVVGQSNMVDQDLSEDESADTGLSVNEIGEIVAIQENTASVENEAGVDIAEEIMSGETISEVDIDEEMISGEMEETETNSGEDQTEENEQDEEEKLNDQNPDKQDSVE